MITIFFHLLGADDKSAALRAAIREPNAAKGKERFEMNVSSFSAIPRSPFAYWVSERLRRLFVDLSPFESEGRLARAGLQTSDDFRFVRAWWEVPHQHLNSSWRPFAKGGSFSRAYSSMNLVANWRDDGYETKVFAEATPGSDHWSRNLRSAEHYRRPGLTWLRRSHSFCVTALPAEALFSDGAQAIFAVEGQLPSIGAATNSVAFDALVKLTAGRTGSGVQFMPGMVAMAPFSERLATDTKMAAAFHRTWCLKRSADTRNETSHAFALPGLLQVTGADITARASTWSQHVRTIEAQLVVIQSDIDERCFQLYGIEEADRLAIAEGFGGNGTEAESSDDVSETEDDAGEDAEADNSTSDALGLAAELVSWSVGVAFGRFDVRLATGAWPMPTEPGPFDPLPACSPGMLTGEDGLPLARPPTDCPLAFPESGVLVDDPGHPQDLTAALRGVFEVVFGARADGWWNDVAALLDPKGHGLRHWLAGSFFEHHLKRYSKSRRKAPIVWQLGTPSGRYSVWLYAHRLTRDSFFQLQNEIVGPKLSHEERQLTNLMQNAGDSPSARERKEIAAQETLVEELRAMLDEVKRVAPLWNPNLDDGVVLTMAPLWRLVPRHKAWQKELKAKWGELAAGKYDWAHLAMHLWPERVVAKCATDRSLAIAHGLEDVFWVKAEDGKWQPRATPTKPIAEVIRERSSPAMKAALKSLTDAPLITARTRRGSAAYAELRG